MKTAILVDGGFYRKRARSLWGEKSAEDRANELYKYCISHMNDVKNYEKDRTLYRIFYYDCPPIEKDVYHPYLQKNIKLKDNDTYIWSKTFLGELKKRRKIALRLGELSQNFAHYNLKIDSTKKLCNGQKEISDLTEKDFNFYVDQKGVDMRIGLDISSLAYKKQVDQIILIAGDSDFVPAAKLARREGIDFILDPMWANIKDDLYEHIDGLNSPCKKKQ